MVRVDFHTPAVAVGETLKCAVVLLPSDEPTPKSLVLRLAWIAQGGRGSMDWHTSAKHVIRAPEGGFPLPTTIELSFPIPEVGPVTYAGATFHLTWHVVVRRTFAGRLDEEETFPFLVLARGQEAIEAPDEKLS